MLDKFITFPVVLLIYIGVGYLAFAHPDYIQFAYLPFSVVFMISAFFLLLLNPRLRFSSRFSSPLSASSNYSLGFLSWIGVLWSGLAVFMLMGQLIQIVLTNFNPYVAKLYISTESYWEAIKPLTQPNHWIYWGYFSALIFWSMSLSYVYYHQQGVPCLHRMAAAVFGEYLTYKKFSIWAKAFGESHVFLVIMTWFGLIMLSSMVLLTTGLLYLISLPSYFTIPIISMSFFSFFFLFFASSFFSKNSKKLNRLNLNFSVVTIILSVFIISLLTLAGKAIQLILNHSPGILKLVECDCTINILKMFIEDRMQNLGWAIWILSLPIMVTFVARISCGRNFWELVLGIFGFAILLQIAGYVYGQTAWFNLISHIHEPLVQLILGFILLIFLVGIFFKKRSSWLFSNGLMKELPRKNEEGIDVYKVSEVSLFDGTKIRGMGSLTRKWIVLCLGMLLIHTLGGWQVLQVELSLFAFILVCLSVFVIFGFWIEWGREKFAQRR
jgi:hypothetical protein